MQCLSVGTARSGERCCRPVPCQLLEVPGLDTTRNPAVERLRSHVRKNDGQAQQVSSGGTKGVRNGTGNRDLWNGKLRRKRDRLPSTTQLGTHRRNAEQSGVGRSAAGHGQGVDTWAHEDFVGDH